MAWEEKSFGQWNFGDEMTTLVSLGVFSAEVLPTWHQIKQCYPPFCYEKKWLVAPRAAASSAARVFF